MKKYTQKEYEAFHESTQAQAKIIGHDNFTYRILLKYINTNIPPHKKVLDIGCGAGTLALYLAAKGCDVVGWDIAKKAIAEAKKSAQKKIT